jgi:cytochrome c biogenesis protein CcmG, thiol:disulfide interchange protein DsbE
MRARGAKSLRGGEVRVVERLQRVWRSGRIRRGAEVLLWVAVLGFVGHRLWPQLAAALAVGSGGAEAPAFEVRTLAGEEVTLESLRGQVVLVNFWATWCPPCRIEMPGFERVYQEKKDEGFVIVGLSTDQAGSREVERFLSDRGITFPVGMASAQLVRDFGGLRGLPTSFLVDREGRIRHTVTGIFAEPALRMAVNRLLAEPDAVDPIDR